MSQEVTNDEPKLSINYAVDEPIQCNRAQASAMYETLDGFQQQINSLILVKDLESLGGWFSVHNDWIGTKLTWLFSEMCDGAAYLLRALYAQARYRAMDRMIAAFTGFSLDDMFVDPRPDAMDMARELAEIDLAAMEDSQDPDIELALNRAVNGLPRCSVERALAFYATLDGFEGQVDSLLLVDSWESLLTWAFNFHLWRTDAWDDFYEQPCGDVLTHSFEIEGKTYLAGIMLVAGLEARASEELAQLIKEWRESAEQDAAVIEDMKGE